MFCIESELNTTLDFANSVLKEVYSSYKKPIIVNVKYSKARSYWAQVRRRGEDMYELIISNVFESIPSEDVARNRFTSSMIHEMIHTIPGCWDHRSKFQRLCRLVNYKYPQYNLQTSTSVEDVGLVEPLKTPRYLVTCKHCGYTYNYMRKPRYDLDKYVCKCGHSTFEMKENITL